jgi:predicted amidohydrolase
VASAACRSQVADERGLRSRSVSRPPEARIIRIAAIQLEPVLGDVAENLRRCRALGDEAGGAGAKSILLPEFFTTGMAFLEAIADAALPPDGAGMQLLQELAGRHRAVVGGSFICRDEDGRTATRGSWSRPTAACSAATTRTSRRCGRTASTSEAATTA